jgi:hypothetical protein
MKRTPRIFHWIFVDYCGLLEFHWIIGILWNIMDDSYQGLKFTLVNDARITEYQIINLIRLIV